jgi:membrane fusion protein, copper/silver efflux system
MSTMKQHGFRIGAIALAVAALGVTAFVTRARWERLLPVGSGTERPVEGLSSPPVRTETARTGISIDLRRQQLIGVRTVAARRSTLETTIRAVGLVKYDETRLSDVNLKIGGWIRDLRVDSTGQAIARGEPLFALYSPDLLAAEREFLLALRTRDEVRASELPDARDHAERLVASARERLSLWDLPAEEIQAIEDSRQSRDTVMFRSPVAGVVIDKPVIAGMHVEAGQTLYTVADLSVVWVEADVYENELPLVHVGQTVTVTLGAYPGERFAGRAVYIYPYVDEATRTNRVRYEFANPRGRLKPGMYANVEIAVSSGEGIVVPTDAVLDSGKEQVVFVAKGDGVFEPRPVTIGRRLGGQIEIVSGVTEGEEVADAATFFLDSESQLRASLQGFAATPVGAGPRAPALDITFRSNPDPPQGGDNQFEVSVKDADGAPIDGAEVLVQFFMPAMPTMNMPAMQSEATLASAGGGLYRGTVQVPMAGRWDLTIAVARSGQRLGDMQTTVVAR